MAFARRIREELAPLPDREGRFLPGAFLTESQGRGPVRDKPGSRQPSAFGKEKDRISILVFISFLR